MRTLENSLTSLLRYRSLTVLPPDYRTQCMSSVTSARAQVLLAAVLQVGEAVPAGRSLRRRARVPHAGAAERHPRAPGPAPTDRLQPGRCPPARDRLQHRREPPGGATVRHQAAQRQGRRVHAEAARAEEAVPAEGARPLLRPAQAQHTVPDDVRHLHLRIYVPLLEWPTAIFAPPSPLADDTDGTYPGRTTRGLVVRVASGFSTFYDTPQCSRNWRVWRNHVGPESISLVNLLTIRRKLVLYRYFNSAEIHSCFVITEQRAPFLSQLQHVQYYVISDLSSKLHVSGIFP